MECLNVSITNLPDVDFIDGCYDLEKEFIDKQDRTVIYDNGFFNIPYNTCSIFRIFIEKCIINLKKVIGKKNNCYNITLCKLFPLSTSTVYYEKIPDNKNKNYMITLTDKIFLKILQNPLSLHSVIDLSVIGRDDLHYLVYNYENTNKFYLLFNFIVDPYIHKAIVNYNCKNIKYDVINDKISAELAHINASFTSSKAIFQNIHLFENTSYKSYMETFFKYANLGKYNLLKLRLVCIFDNTYIELKKLLGHLTNYKNINYTDLYMYILYIHPDDNASYLKNKHDVYVLNTGQEVFIENRNYIDKELYINNICYIYFNFLEKKPSLQ